MCSFRIPKAHGHKKKKSAVNREITAKLNRQSADSTAWLAANKKLRDEITEEINNAEVVSLTFIINFKSSEKKYTWIARSTS